MQKTFLGLVILSIFFTACVSKPDYAPETNPTLSGNAKLLIGRWEAQMEVDSQTNNTLAYTDYDSASITFTNTYFTSYSPSSYLLCEDASGLAAGETMIPGNTPTAGDAYWYINDTANVNKLVVSGYEYDINTLNDSVMVLHRASTDTTTHNRYYYFAK